MWQAAHAAWRRAGGALWPRWAAASATVGAMTWGVGTTGDYAAAAAAAAGADRGDRAAPAFPTLDTIRRRYGPWLGADGQPVPVRSSRDIALENAAALGFHAANHAEAVYGIKSMLAAADGGTGLIKLRTHADVHLLSRAVAVTVVVRGSSTAAAAQAKAAAADVAVHDASGALWFVVDDDTPADVVEYFDKLVHVHSSPPAVAPPAMPVVILMDRMGTQRRKHLLLGAHPSCEARVTEFGSPPSRREVADALAAMAGGTLPPWLIGDDTPQGNAHPAFPFLTLVVSDTWHDVVLDPHHDVVLEAYLTDCPMCMALAGRVRMAAALAAQHFPHVKVAVMNVDDNERPLDWMPTKSFPSIQMFSVSAKGDGSGATAAIDFPITKMTGPACPHLDHTAASPHAVHDLDSPPCIPAYDFRHPTKPTARALPTVPELVAWIGRHSSSPFDLDMRIATAPGTPPCTLRQACEAMEKEARELENLVFAYMWYYSALDGLRRLCEVDGQHWPLHDAFARVVAHAKAIVVDGGMAGKLSECEAALNACADFEEGHGVGKLVRAFLLDQAEAETEVKALALARQLV